MSAHALKLYLYLAANSNNYELALSPAAVRQEIGMARSTYHDQFHILEDKGYIRHSHGNTYEFFEKPCPRTDNQEVKQEFSDGFDFTAVDNPILSDGQPLPQGNTEINNINIKDKIINNDEIQPQNVYRPKEVVINIPPPVAEGRNRPKPIQRKKPFSDIF